MVWEEISVGFIVYAAIVMLYAYVPTANPVVFAVTLNVVLLKVELTINRMDVLVLLNRIQLLSDVIVKFRSKSAVLFIVMFPRLISRGSVRIIAFVSATVVMLSHV